MIDRFTCRLRAASPPAPRGATPLRAILLGAILLGLGGCASFDIGDADRSTTPAQAAKTIDTVRGRTVAWGGVIVNGKNMADKSELEIVGYPLDGTNRPLTEEGPTSRFIVVQPGYLEVADYAPGREVTVVGTVGETRTGKVGEASYVYPVVAAKTLHLWPKTKREKTEPQFHFGIGIGILR